MKQILFLFALLFSIGCFAGIYQNINEIVEQTETGCKYKGKKLYRGKRGGCFYFSGGEKVYVDRSYCNC